MRIVGAILALGGTAILVGYGLYYLAMALGDLPLLVAIAIVALAAGFLLLLTSIAWERFHNSKKETFKEIDR